MSRWTRFYILLGDLVTWMFPYDIIKLSHNYNKYGIFSQVLLIIVFSEAFDEWHLSM